MATGSKNEFATWRHEKSMSCFVELLPKHLPFSKIFRIFAADNIKKNMQHQQVIDNIKQVAKSTLPQNSTLLLYGSRARGDSHDGSDWDLLILLDKPKLVANDYDMTYPFRELGWKIGEEISPHIYTKKQWSEWTFLPYYKNVEQEKIVLV